MLDVNENTSIKKSIFTLISGTTVAQIIPFLLQPFLRRIYAVEAFGSYALYLNIVSILTIIVTLRYEQAIILPKNDKQAVNLLKLSFLLSLSFNILFFVIILIFINTIIQFLNFNYSYRFFIYFLPLGVFLLSFYEALNYYLIRLKKFKASSVNKISRRFSEGLGQSTIGYFNKNLGLIIGDIIGNFLNVFAAFFQLRSAKLRFNKFNFFALKYVLKKYINFPKFQLFPYFLSALCLSFPVFYMNKWYDANIVGVFDLSRQVLSIPLVLISAAIGQVLFQTVAEKIKFKKHFKNIIYNIGKILLFFAIIEVLIIVFFGPDLFSFVFGSQYYYSGVISKVLVFSYVMRFIVTPFSVILIGLEKLKINALWQLFYFVGMYGILFFIKLEIFYFILGYVIYEIIAYLIYFLIIIRQVNNYEKTLH